MRIIRNHEFQESRWRNGRGISAEIASDPPGAGAADPVRWRFALAQIDADVPFSAFPGLDRIFTLVGGDAAGVTLDIAGLGQTRLRTGEQITFAGEVQVSCRLNGARPCRALNLFVARNLFKGSVEVHDLTMSGEVVVQSESVGGARLAYVISGRARLGAEELQAGDAVLLSDEGETAAISGTALIYAGQVSAIAQ